ncbi:MAG: phosphatase PAP2 family protein, partial [Solobacterium sp.]|nr:phosphatase PAP2 family protein [Solobacterium sp.]
CPLIFTVFVAVSRIMGGMHFLSDVMAGAGIFAIVFISLLYRNSRHTQQDS